MRKTVISAGVLLVGCGGAPFSAADPGDDAGGDVVQTVDAVPADAGGSQRGDAGPDAREELTGQVVPVHEGGEAGQQFVEASVDATPDVDAAPACVTDLSGVGTGDFRVDFVLTTTTVPAAAAYMALLNQRSRCDDTRPGWDVWMTAQGNLGVEVFDGSGGAYDNVTDNRSVNDGVAHDIVVSRSGTSLKIGIDGVFNTYPNEPIMSLAALSPMNVGIDPTCTGVSNISGRLIDVCITKQ